MWDFIQHDSFHDLIDLGGDIIGGFIAATLALLGIMYKAKKDSDKTKATLEQEAQLGLTRLGQSEMEKALEAWQKLVEPLQKRIDCLEEALKEERARTLLLKDRIHKLENQLDINQKS